MENAFSYAGKRALVVGCFSGMGAATAQIVQSLGGEVHGVDYKAPEYDVASFTPCDLRDEVQIDSMLATVGTGWDAVFYCAGLPQTHPPLDVMKVNFVAMRKVVDALVEGMGAGSAVAIISSNAGLQFMNHMAEISELIDTPDFDAAMAWCEARPELIKAFYGPLDRAAQPEEMGWPLVFLNSDAATFITGMNLIVDGGFTAGMTTGLIDLNELLAGLAEATG